MLYYTTVLRMRKYALSLLICQLQLFPLKTPVTLDITMCAPNCIKDRGIWCYQLLSIIILIQ